MPALPCFHIVDFCVLQEVELFKMRLDVYFILALIYSSINYKTIKLICHVYYIISSKLMNFLSKISKNKYSVTE